MKKVFYLSVMTLFALVSCNKELETPSASEQNVVTFTANVDGADTKTTLVGLKPHWLGQESIQVVGEGGNYWFNSENNAEPTPTTTFSYSGEYKDEGKPVMAVYPAGAKLNGGNFGKDMANQTVQWVYLNPHQRAVAGDIDLNAAISMAYTENKVFNFKNATSFLKVTISEDSDPATKIGIYNDNAILAGEVDIKYNDGEPQIVHGENYSTSNYAGIEGTIEPGKTYYIGILPCELTDGFTFEYIIDGVPYERIATNPAVIGRNMIFDLHTVELKASVQTKKVYFKPDTEWENEAWFSAYTWVTGQTGVFNKMTDENNDGIYEAEVNAKMNNISFVSFAKETESEDWSKKLRQTNNLTFDNECYAVNYDVVGNWMTLDAAESYTAATGFYLLNDSGHDNLNIYTWEGVEGSGTAVGNAWPGSAISAKRVVGGIEYLFLPYSDAQKGKLVHVILNNNNGFEKSISSEIILDKNHYLNITSNKAILSKYGVYVIKYTNWEKLYVYAHGDTGHMFDNWPGQEMTAKRTVNDTEYYYIGIDDSHIGKNSKLIFNNNNGNQTGDYWVEPINGNVFVKINSNLSFGSF